MVADSPYKHVFEPRLEVLTLLTCMMMLMVVVMLMVIKYLGSELGACDRK